MNILLRQLAIIPFHFYIPSFNIQLQGLNQDLETVHQKLAIVKLWGILFFMVDHKIFRLQVYNHNHVYGHDWEVFLTINMSAYKYEFLTASELF